MVDRRGAGASRAAGTTSPDTAHRAALDLLARRAHFESEIERKLEQKGFAPGDVRAALERLRSARLVDDRRTAVELVASRLRRAPQGRRRLRAELARRGVAPETIDAALEEALPRGDEAALATEAARRFRQRRRTADTRALQRHLDRMGFSARDILATAEEPEDLQPPDDDGC